MDIFGHFFCFSFPFIGANTSVFSLRPLPLQKERPVERGLPGKVSTENSSVSIKSFSHYSSVLLFLSFSLSCVNYDWWMTV